MSSRNGSRRMVATRGDDSGRPLTSRLAARRVLFAHDHRVRATFFLIDEHITAETAPVVKRIAEDGHVIGLHSGNRWLMLDGADAMSQKIQDAAARIRAITSREPCRLFRPHGGWRSAAMYAGLRKAGYTLVGWSWGMWDWNWWRGPNVDPLVSRLARSTSPGRFSSSMMDITSIRGPTAGTRSNS